MREGPSKKFGSGCVRARGEGKGKTELLWTHNKSEKNHKDLSHRSGDA